MASIPLTAGELDEALRRAFEFARALDCSGSSDDAVQEVLLLMLRPRVRALSTQCGELALISGEWHYEFMDRAGSPATFQQVLLHRVRQQCLDHKRTHGRHARMIHTLTKANEARACSQGMRVTAESRKATSYPADSPSTVAELVENDNFARYLSRCCALALRGKGDGRLLDEVGIRIWGTRRPDTRGGRTEAAPPVREALRYDDPVLAAQPASKPSRSGHRPSRSLCDARRSPLRTADHQDDPQRGSFCRLTRHSALHALNMPAQQPADAAALPRVAKTLKHAFHVLPLRVAKQALQVALRVAGLPASYESAREAIEELRQSLQQVELDRAQPPSRTAMSVLVQSNVRRTAGSD